MYEKTLNYENGDCMYMYTATRIKNKCTRRVDATQLDTIRTKIEQVIGRGENKA